MTEGGKESRDFHERYAQSLTHAQRRLECEAFGEVRGRTGYTTVEQARSLFDHLRLSSTSKVLELGAGRGWLGIYARQLRGSSVILSDRPIEALREARRYALEARVERGVAGVCANGETLPFASGSFDAALHSDLLC